MVRKTLVRAAISGCGWLALATANALAQPLPAPPPASASEPPDIWHRDTLTGDWGGLRSDLAARGVTLTATYTGELLANVRGGIQRGAEYDGLFLPQLDINLDKLAGWHGGSLRVSMLEVHGPQLSAGWVGNVLNVSGIAAPPATRLYNLWLQQNLFDDAVSVRAGLMNADAEFMVTPTASMFLNSGFGWLGWAATDLPAGGPTSSLPAPGIRLRLKPTEEIRLSAAVFSGDPTGHNGSNGPPATPSGTVISFRGGVFLIGELGYVINRGEDTAWPRMGYRIGAWYHTSSRFQDQRFDASGLSLASPVSSGNPAEHRSDWGIFGVADVPLYPVGDDGGLSGFVRMGGSPADRNLIDLYVDAGLAYKGLLPERDGDTLGFGVAYAHISPRARALDRDVRQFSNPLFPVRGEEVAVELSYQAQLTQWLIVQPDLQWIIHPSGGVLNQDGSLRRDAMVIGLRSVLSF